MILPLPQRYFPSHSTIPRNFRDKNFVITSQIRKFTKIIIVPRKYWSYTVYIIFKLFMDWCRRANTATSKTLFFPVRILLQLYSNNILTGYSNSPICGIFEISRYMYTVQCHCSPNSPDPFSSREDGVWERD